MVTHPVRRCVHIALLLLLGLVQACGESEPAPVLEQMDLDRGTVRLLTSTDTFQVAVEIADSDAARAYGLMDRDRLEENDGMLFIFQEDRPAESGFYMYRTRIPLDAAFVDSAGTIVAIHTMEPCSSPVPAYCHHYAPGATYRQVLEVNGGYFESHGITVGDRLVQER